MRCTLAIDEACIAAMYIWKSRAGSRCSVIRMLVVFTSSRASPERRLHVLARRLRRRVHSDSSAADITCAWMPPTSRHTDASVDSEPPIRWCRCQPERGDLFGR